MAALVEGLSALMPWFQQGGSLAGALDFSAQDLEVFYTAGYDVFQQGRLEEALKVFGWLAALEPSQSRFHHAVATCLQGLGRHRDAAASYVLLKLMEPDNPEPLLRLAECLLATGDREEAAGLLDALLEEGGPAPAPASSTPSTSTSSDPTAPSRSAPGPHASPPADRAAWLQRAQALRSLLRQAQGTPTPSPPTASPQGAAS